MAPSRTLDRRQFLCIAGIVGAVAALPSSLRVGAWIAATADGLHPGAQVTVAIAPDVPTGCSVRLRADHPAGRGHGGPVNAVAGTSASLETPYPFNDLVEGDYTVRAELCSASGRVLESSTVGVYRVRRFRFSA
ncbi:MAG: hypothetical protein EXR77_00945 [Myxococcales bacterium]|nr:hypothetical protein [Myxococcales bacterium]